MRRKAAAWLLLATLSGCMSFQSGPETGGGDSVPHYGRSFGPPTVPGVQGPYGTPVAMAAPYNSAPPGSMFQAQQMMNRSVPMSAVQINGGCGPAGCPVPNMMPGM